MGWHGLFFMYPMLPNTVIHHTRQHGISLPTPTSYLAQLLEYPYLDMSYYGTAQLYCSPSIWMERSISLSWGLVSARRQISRPRCEGALCSRAA